MKCLECDWETFQICLNALSMGSGEEVRSSISATFYCVDNIDRQNASQMVERQESSVLSVYTVESRRCKR